MRFCTEKATSDTRDQDTDGGDQDLPVIEEVDVEEEGTMADGAVLCV